MKYYIIALLLVLVSSAYAIKVGDSPILPLGVKVGYGNIGVSSGGGGVITYWATSTTDYWNVDNTALWNTTTDTEVP